MDLNNSATPPSAPSQSTQGQNTSDDSLYAQITAEDAPKPVQPKKKKAPLFVQLIVQFMQLTFYLDSIKRTHEPIFRFLGSIWACFMAILYIGGLLTLVISVYSMMQLPLFLEDQLRQRGLEFDKLQLADYSMTRIEVQNLKDKSGIYEVDSLIINSSFADFLQKRIRSVTLNGLRVHVEEKENGSLLDELPLILNELKNPTRGKLGLAIDAISIHDAIIDFKQGMTSIPISFTMEGVYDNKTEILIPLHISQPNLSADATLSVNGQGSSTDWKLEITSGKLKLPKRSSEDLRGNVVFKVVKDRIDSINFDMKLSFGTIEKDLQGTLTRLENKGMSASIIWAESNLTEPDLSSQIRFNFEELILGKNTIESHKKIQIYAQSFITSLMKLKDLSTVVVGDLVCRDWTECSFALTVPSTVTFQDSIMTYHGKTIHTGSENTFVLQPSENTMFMSLNDPYLIMQWKMSDVSVAGYFDTKDDPFHFNSLNVDLNGHFSDLQKSDNRLSVQTVGTEYAMNKLQFIDGDIEISDVLNPSRQVHVLARSISAPVVPLLTVPFDMELTMLGNQARIQMQPKDTNIVISLDGQFLPFQPAFLGTINIPEFTLTDMKLPMKDTSPLLTSNVSDISGRFAVAGQLVWKGQNMLSGPVKLAVKDLSFKWGKTKVSGVNSVLSLSSVLPFATESNQRVFIQEIQAALPFTSTDVALQIENQTLRLINLNTHLGNVELSMPPSVIPLRNPSMLLFLKNDAPIDLATLFDYMNIPALDSIKGSANVSIPVEVQNTKVSIPSVTFKMTNAALKRNGDRWPDLFGHDTDYIMRSGQVIVGQNGLAQIATDGRLFPSREKKVFEYNDLEMSFSLFKKGSQVTLPRVIQEAQKQFFTNQE